MDGVNFDINNSSVRRVIALNKLYGIAWREVKYLEEESQGAQSGRKEIYFTTANDALKVANFFNEVSENKQFSVVSVTYDTLMKKKKEYLADKSIPKENPIAYCKATGFRIYSSASEYFRVMRFNYTDDTDKTCDESMDMSSSDDMEM